MAFFSFSLLKEPFIYLSTKIESNQKYYSKDITLRKELNNINKTTSLIKLNYEKRININKIGKKLLICLPPKFGLGDAIEYGIALNSLAKSNKFKKIGIAFCNNHLFIFKNFFSFLNVYPLLISQDQINNYDTIFHITLEIKALKFQKYNRSNIALEICKYFNVNMIEFKIDDFSNRKNNQKTISVFPVSTSTIRVLPLYILEKIIDKFKDDYEIKIVLDDSEYSKFILNKIQNYDVEFINPKDVKSLVLEISKIYFGIFVDSGPLHIAKSFNKKGIFIETSVSKEILLNNSNNILPIKNKYISNYCTGPCGLVDLFAYDGVVGCYETHKISFEDINLLKSFKKLQRWDKKDNNSHFFSNPVGCVKKIDIKNIIELIKRELKE